MPKVYNHHHKNVPQFAVNIGRPSPWGNPFTHLTVESLTAFKVKDRKTAVACYDGLLDCFTTGSIEKLLYQFGVDTSSPMMLDILLEKADWMRRNMSYLKGKDLACWCKPLACHGDVLLRRAGNL